MIEYSKVDTLSSYDLILFSKNYLGKKPVLFKGFIEKWPAVQKWDNRFLKKLFKNKKLGTKFGNIQNENIHKISFDEFIEYAETMEQSENPPKIEDTKYIHDIPIFTLFENLKKDVEPFPVGILPKWYQFQWWKKIIFFYGAKHSTTPLHIDSLCTHNFFFQIKGTKRFIFILKEEENYCYPRNFNYYHVDPEKPDYHCYPLFQKAKPFECIVEAGDMLYFPPICLHQVRSLTNSISINMDWHNKRSILGVFPRLFGKMTKKDMYYNFICMLGVVFGIPAKLLLPFYQPYLGITNAIE